MEEKYQKIAKLPHPSPQSRLRMSPQRRAAQFAPFAALTDYGGIILETARQTEREIELDETAVAAIDACLRLLRQNIAQCPWVRVRFFCPDGKKAGGSYRSLCVRAVQVDGPGQRLVLGTGERIPFDRIAELEMEKTGPEGAVLPMTDEK